MEPQKQASPHRPRFSNDGNVNFKCKDIITVNSQGDQESTTHAPTEDVDVHYERLDLRLVGRNKGDQLKIWEESASGNAERGILRARVEFNWAGTAEETNSQPLNSLETTTEESSRPLEETHVTDTLLDLEQDPGLPAHAALSNLDPVHNEASEDQRPYHAPSKLDTRTRGIARKRAECYRRTAMLALLHLPQALEFLYRHVQSHCGIPDCLSCILHGIASELWNSSKVCIYPKQLAGLDSLVTHSHSAVDSHEPQRDWMRDLKTPAEPAVFLVWMIETLRSQSQRETSSTAGLDALFGLETSRYWICQNCTGRFAKTEAPIVDLVTTLKPPPDKAGSATLGECFRRRPLGIGNSRRECSECRRPMREYGRITKAPAVLFFELRRSEMAVTRYPERFELAEMSRSVAAPACGYLLAAVICRQRGTREGRVHYTLYARIASGAVVYMDDERVMGSNGEAMLMPGKGISEDDEAYLLVYRSVPVADRAVSGEEPE